MNEVEENVTDAALEMKVLKVHPFEARPTCEKCGFTVTLLEYLRSGGSASAAFVYCEGSLEPTVEVNRLFVGKTEVKTTCFGVFVEHLHLSCNRCSWHWLMATKGGKR